MWRQKFGFVVGNALTFPFKHFSEISRLLLKVTLVLSLLILLISLGGLLIPLIESHNIEMQPFLGLILLLLLMGGLFIFMTTLTFFIGIVRFVVIGDTDNSSILSMIFTRRYSLCLWANIKIIFASLPILIIVFMLTFLLVKLFYPIGPAVMESPILGTDTFLSPEEIERVKFGAILFRASWGIIFFTLVSRWYFAVAMAALDKNPNLRDAWTLTRGNWWLIVLSMTLVCGISAIAGWSIWTVSIFILSPLINMFGPLIMGPIVAVIYAAAILFTAMPVLALYGYLYQAVTNQLNNGAASE